MVIKLKQFGTMLMSRPSGREATLVLQSLLKDLKEKETIEINFEGVEVFSPGWGDEVLTPLLNTYGERLILKKSSNGSIAATLEIVEEQHGKKFNVVD